MSGSYLLQDASVGERKACCVSGVFEKRWADIGHTAVLAVLLSISWLLNVTFAQTYPPTFKVPVTLYDFHADNQKVALGGADYDDWEGSNPEFESNKRPRWWINPAKGMVKPDLDGDDKPVGDTLVCCASRYIHRWFRPWQPGDFSRPIYSRHNETGAGWVVSLLPPYTDTCSYKIIDTRDAAWAGYPFYNSDSSFKNVVLDTFLTFTQVSGSVYKFEQFGFFPLSGKGFGAEPPYMLSSPNTERNYGFTMEIKGNFVYKGTEMFSFLGDDDVWVFINKYLEMDIGGIHSSQADSISLSPTCSLLKTSLF